MRPTSVEQSTANEWHLGHELAMSIDGHDARIAVIDGLSGRRLDGFLVGSTGARRATRAGAHEIARIRDEARAIPVHDLAWRQPRANAK